jgi:putative thioredoxin
MSDPRSAPSIFTRGAVDLGALRAPAGAPAGPSAPASNGASTGGGPPLPGGSSSDSMIIDVTEETFQTDVIERSMTTPVVIDFWAEWCEPCKQLTPVLEKLAREGGGAWTLARINIDENQRIAAMFRVQSIPLVYAVVGGQPVDAFNGVIPETQLRQWIGAVAKAGGVAIEEPIDARYDGADEALVNGDLDAAETAYKQILADAPADSAAEAGLAQVGLLRRIENVDFDGVIAAAGSTPDDVDAQMLAADVQVASGEAEQAYQRLVDLVRRTSGSERDKARTHLVSLFLIAGPDDPVVAAARRALASALF